MLILRTLCRWFPGMRWFFVAIGYLMMLIGGLIWFLCFPLTVYTLYVAGQFPFDYFGIPVDVGIPLDSFLPRDMWRAVGGICAGFTLWGLFTIYFNVRNLRRLRLGEI